MTPLEAAGRSRLSLNGSNERLLPWLGRSLKPPPRTPLLLRLRAAGTLRLATTAAAKLPCVTAAIRVVELYSRQQNCSGSQR